MCAELKLRCLKQKQRNWDTSCESEELGTQLWPSLLTNRKVNLHSNDRHKHFRHRSVAKHMYDILCVPLYCIKCNYTTSHKHLHPECLYNDRTMCPAKCCTMKHFQALSQTSWACYNLSNCASDVHWKPMNGLTTNCLLDFVHRPNKILKYNITITTFRKLVRLPSLITWRRKKNQLPKRRDFIF
jgi:hypothetical protein